MGDMVMGMLQRIHGKKLGLSKILASSALTALAIAGTSQTTHAALVATDNAAASAYSGGWSNGSNGGSGFGEWSLSGSSTSGFFVGSSTENDNGNALLAGDTSDIDTAGNAWGMYANSGTSATAARDFTGGALAVGQSFSLAYDNGNIATGSADVFNLIDSSNNTLFQFGFAGGASNYFYSDATSIAADTGIGFTYFGLDTVFTLTSATTYSFTMTPIDTSLASKTITGTISGNITGFSAVDDNAGSGSGSNFYINSAEVLAAPSSAVPTPASFGLVLAGGIGLAGLAIRRRIAVART
jgi:hypothetical protein